MRTHRRPAVAALLVAASALAACAGDSVRPDAVADHRGATITAWSTESRPDRLATTAAILDDFTKASGIKVELVGVPAARLRARITRAAAAGRLPDVVLGASLAE